MGRGGLGHKPGHVRAISPNFLNGCGACSRVLRCLELLEQLVRQAGVRDGFGTLGCNLCAQETEVSVHSEAFSWSCLPLNQQFKAI